MDLMCPLQDVDVSWQCERGIVGDAGQGRAVKAMGGTYADGEPRGLTRRVVAVRNPLVRMRAASIDIHR